MSYFQHLRHSNQKQIGIGADEGTRTPKYFHTYGPEPYASANSATSANSYAIKTAYKHFYRLLLYLKIEVFAIFFWKKFYFLGLFFRSHNFRQKDADIITGTLLVSSICISSILLLVCKVEYCYLFVISSIWSIRGTEYIIAGKPS